MAHEEIHDPAQFFHRLDGLHDARIETIDFDASARTLTLIVSDSQSNINSFPQYAGKRAAAFEFHHVQCFTADIEAKEGIRIGDVGVSTENPNIRIEIDLNLGGGDLTRGRASITVIFQKLRITSAPQS